MNNTPHDGGPAFPHEDTMSTGFRPGMSLRDYFIAHAPEEPQPWFEPAAHPSFDVLPEPPGLVLASQKAIDERDAFLADELEAADIKDPIVRDYALAFDASVASRERWGAERTKQRYIQWPAAWADAMLAERENSRTAPSSGTTILADAGPGFTRVQVLRDGVPIAFQNIPTDAPLGLVSVLLRDLIVSLDAAGERIIGQANQGVLL